MLAGAVKSPSFGNSCSFESFRFVTPNSGMLFSPLVFVFATVARDSQLVVLSADKPATNTFILDIKLTIYFLLWIPSQDGRTTNVLGPVCMHTGEGKCRATEMLPLQTVLFTICIQGVHFSLIYTDGLAEKHRSVRSYA